MKNVYKILVMVMVCFSFIVSNIANSSEKSVTDTYAKYAEMQSLGFLNKFPQLYVLNKKHQLIFFADFATEKALDDIMKKTHKISTKKTLIDSMKIVNNLKVLGGKKLKQVLFTDHASIIAIIIDERRFKCAPCIELKQKMSQYAKNIKEIDFLTIAISDDGLGK